MKKKYLLAASPLLLSIISLMISRMVGSSVGSDGILHEPAFFLIPLSYLFFFCSIVAFLFVGLGSVLNNRKKIS
ncbi:DUF3955 domain-containing protein [Paenibacillus sp. FSL R5-0744]|uniref:DUF3955 domain-containing protein n=1 Tax=unclassified Paenibacillus TaxID=185978 RepID=UPI0004F885B7|nr:DUF3955 domain-containing protein [Paenibacillus sp. FSL H7-0737]AIQ23957.1 group-specific protein [Paenibacillus sp. FSL H7-0737]